MDTLKFESRGADVKKLQNLLNKILKINPPLVVDGHFGNKTLQAVKTFQVNYNLDVDGVVGPITWKYLIQAEQGVMPKPEPVNINTAEANWLKYAKQEIGQSEIVGKKNNPKIIEYHATTTLAAKTDEVPWCSSFVNWVLKQANIKGSDSAAAISWMQWGKTTTKKAGAITVIYNKNAANSNLSSSGNHVGFLIEETSTHYKILGGNQSDQVKVSSYPKKSWTLRGYRWPN